jgi:TetR/AcrR family transcriptional regulator, transcriptional repressor for nem operon
MRYDKGHKDVTRKRIVDVASKRFRKEGVEAVGLAGLMADAGLTHGGFYAYFKSKEDLVREAVSDAFGQTNAAFQSALRENEDGFAIIMRGYLKSEHRDHPELGCAAAALTAEIARHPEPTREAFTSRLNDLIDLVEAQLPVVSPDRRRKCATAVVALMVGSLQLARAETDAARSAEILESGAEAALALRDRLNTG